MSIAFAGETNNEITRHGNIRSDGAKLINHRQINVTCVTTIHFLQNMV